MKLYGEFDEDGYHVASYFLSKDGKPHWLLRVSKDGTVVKEEYLPMTYEPRWGFDVVDVATLEAETDRVLKEFKSGNN